MKVGDCTTEARGFSPVKLVARRLDTLTAGQLDDLGEALLDFRTIADLQQWLDLH